MGIYVKGMKMPKSCWSCFCSAENVGVVCNITGDRVESQGRSDNCPLVEVLTPHGRLIDENTALDKLCDVGEAKTDKWERGMNFYDMQKGLSITPTVIEAEDE